MFPCLNLLPPEQKKDIQRAGVFMIIHEIILFIFIAIVFGSALLLEARLILEQKFREVIIENAPGAAKITRINRDILNLNKRLSALDTITSKSPFWSKLIIDIITNTPAQINYKLLNLLDTSDSIPGTKTIQLSGTALTREALINLKNTLESYSGVTKVELPLQYLVKTQDSDFTINITINSVQ